MPTLGQDFRYGTRMLAKQPGFTAAAVITLSVGLGANTAIFFRVTVAALPATAAVLAPARRASRVDTNVRCVRTDPRESVWRQRR